MHERTVSLQSAKSTDMSAYEIPASILRLSLLQINDLLCTLTHFYMWANYRAAS